MENIDELNNALGAENVKLFLDEIQKGRIKDQKVKMIGVKMGGSVHGVFIKQSKQGQLELHEVMRHMMDRWFDESIDQPGEDGLAKLVKIFEDDDVGLKALARKMKPGRLTIGLPETHYRIPLLQESSNVTASQAFTSNQSGLTCASDSVAKAAVEILDDFGYDSVQQNIIDALVQPNREPKNPSEFNGKRIKVYVTEKNDKAQKGEIEIELDVQTHWGVVDDSNHTVSTIPVAMDLKGKNMKMVVRWDIGITLDNKNIKGPHAIFAKDYNIATENYSCINSWGDVEPYPKIHKSRIYAVDYISIIQTT